MRTKILFLTCCLGLAGCGDDVTNDRRTVYVESEGQSSDATGDQSGQTDSSGNQNSGRNDGTGSSDDTGDTPNNPPGTTLEGAIVSISALGLVQGWAIDQDDLEKAVEIRFYMGGDQNSGTEVGVATADKGGFDNNNDGNHRFEFQIPEEYRDGLLQSMTAYMEDADQTGPISAQAKSFTAYAPSTEGRDYYEGTVLATLQGNCQGCHPDEVNYANHFRLLLDKSPAEGGTATDNRLILKANGGLNHGGNNRCGNINNGACALFQEWWDREFGG